MEAGFTECEFNVQTAETAVLLIIYIQHTVQKPAVEYCSHVIFFTHVLVCRNGMWQHHGITEWVYCQRLQ